MGKGKELDWEQADSKIKKAGEKITAEKLDLGEARRLSLEALSYIKSNSPSKDCGELMGDALNRMGNPDTPVKNREVVLRQGTPKGKEVVVVDHDNANKTDVLLSNLDTAKLFEGCQPKEK